MEIYYRGEGGPNRVGGSWLKERNRHDVRLGRCRESNWRSVRTRVPFGLFWLHTHTHTAARRSPASFFSLFYSLSTHTHTTTHTRSGLWVRMERERGGSHPSTLLASATPGGVSSPYRPCRLVFRCVRILLFLLLLFR